MKIKRNEKQRTKRFSKKSEKKDLKEKIVGEEERDLVRQPHSIIIHRGLVGQFARNLVHDLRKMMEPNTASRLKVMKRNNLRDFIDNGVIFGVTHLLVITRGEQYLTLRMIRSPQGPTLTFRVKEYTLARQVYSSLKRKVHFPEQFKTAPLVVMSGFSSNDGKHFQLVQSMFQNMFPTMNVDTVLAAIKAVPSGLSKSAKKLLQSKIPDLSKYKDISDYFVNPGQLSESEYEFEQKEVELPQDLTTRGCVSGQKTNVRLFELGPRLSIELVKIEEGIDDGEVLYHSYLKKSVEELTELKKGLEKRRHLKQRLAKANEYRVVSRLKRIATEKEEMEKEFESRKETLIRRQREVTGDNDSDGGQAYREEQKKDEERNEKRVAVRRQKKKH